MLLLCSAEYDMGIEYVKVGIKIISFSTLAQWTIISKRRDHRFNCHSHMLSHPKVCQWLIEWIPTSFISDRVWHRKASLYKDCTSRVELGVWQGVNLKVELLGLILCLQIWFWLFANFQPNPFAAMQFRWDVCFPNSCADSAIKDFINAGLFCFFNLLVDIGLLVILKFKSGCRSHRMFSCY